MWVKLHADILGDPKLQRAMRRGVRNLWLLPWLMIFAGRADEDGALSVNGEPAEPDDILDGLPFDNLTPADVTQVLVDLTSLGVLTQDRAGLYSFVRWAERQGPPSSHPKAVRKRVAAWRKRQEEAELGLSNDSGNSEGACYSNKIDYRQDVDVDVDSAAKSNGSKPQKFNLKPYLAAYRDLTQSDAPAKKWAADLKAVEKDVGLTVALDRWTAYIEQLVAKDEVRFASASNFRRQHGTIAPKKRWTTVEDLRE